MHGLGEKMISLLISIGRKDAASVLHTDNQDRNSLLNYHNLRVINSEMQLSTFFLGFGVLQGEILDQELFQEDQRDKKKQRLDNEFADN